MSTVNSDLYQVTNHLIEEGTIVDNELQIAFDEIGFDRQFIQQGIVKRSGDPIKRILFALVIFPLLGIETVKCFCGKFISAYLEGGKDVLYDFLKREDINWRKISMTTAKEVYLQNHLDLEEESALVVDDTLKIRRGSKVEGVSSHYDHNNDCYIMGQQILELALVNSKGLLPLDRQIYIGEKYRRERQKQFNDGRSAVAKDYQDAKKLNKNQALSMMVRRSLKGGFRSKYLLGDSWFGTKGNLELALDSDLIGIFMMKRGKLQYRLQGGMYNAKGLFELIRRRMKRRGKQRWRTYELVVDLNLHEKGQEERWVQVKLVFTSPLNPSKDCWNLILTTDSSMKIEDILRVYALRWSIEVYFKEIKQNMNFLKEQTGNYVCHYASIHLAAIRFLLFFHMMLSNGYESLSQVRNTNANKMEVFSYMAVLWKVFRHLIYGVLDQFSSVIGGKLVQEMKQSIEREIQEFLEQALSLDEQSFHLQNQAESKGID